MGARELDEYRQQFEQIKSEARELTKGLTEVQFNWRPTPQQWSAKECLGRLTLVGNVEMPPGEQSVDTARRQGIGTKLPSPSRFTPLHGQPLAAVLLTVLHVQSQFRQIDRSAGLALARAKVATPLSQWLKMSREAIFQHAIAHERPPVDQAWQAREKLPS